MNNPPIKKKNSLSGIFFPIIILILTITVTGALYYYDNEITNNNNKLLKDIKKVEEKIKETKKDDNLIVRELLLKNKKVFNKLNTYTQIPKFIEGFDKIKRKHYITLKSFKYNNGIINTKATARYIDSSDPCYITTARFLEEYREDKNAYFDLSFVDKFTNIKRKLGNKDMEFSVKLKVKENIIKNNSSFNNNNK